MIYDFTALHCIGNNSLKIAMALSSISVIANSSLLKRLKIVKDEKVGVEMEVGTGAAAPKNVMELEK